MLYLYHRVPSEMQGTILYPLNRLKELFPKNYEAQAQKYIGREFLMEYKIPVLDCLWNDVLHLSAIDPDEIASALRQSGASIAPNVQYYQIDPFSIEKENAIIFTMTDWDNIDVARYNPEEIGKYTTLPESTKEYYREAVASERKPLLHHKTSHILYRGTIDVSMCGIKTIV